MPQIKKEKQNLFTVSQYTHPHPILSKYQESPEARVSTKTISYPAFDGTQNGSWVRFKVTHTEYLSTFVRHLFWL